MSAPRIALVGAGRWTRAHHAPATIAAGARIEAVVDPDPRAAQALADAVGASIVVGDVEALGEQLQLDGAVVATPHKTHAPIARWLLDRGLALMVDKPLALTAEDAFDLVERAHDSLVVVGYSAQFTDAAAACRRWVQEEIGELTQVVAEFSSRAAAMYARASADDARSAYSAAGGGGQATTQLTHALASICWVTAAQAGDVMAMTANRGHAVDVVDAATFRLNGGSADGVLGTAASTGALAEGQAMRHVVRYLGTDGVVEHDLLWSTARLERPDAVHFVGPDHMSAPYPAHAPVSCFVGLLDRCEGSNPGPVAPAAAAVAFVEAVQRSAAAREMVTVPQLPTHSGKMRRERGRHDGGL
jgi:predicted dehydrogenase